LGGGRLNPYAPIPYSCAKGDLPVARIGLGRLENIFV
jgi:hypothetical protein